jgi:two-component sensor histidine kinase
VHLSKIGSKIGSKLELAVTDDGIGCADKATGVGTQLVTLLMAQLGGSAKWEPAHPGCRVCGVFPLA